MRGIYPLQYTSGNVWTIMRVFVIIIVINRNFICSRKIKNVFLSKYFPENAQILRIQFYLIK